MSWTEPERCALCGNVDRRELRWSLVRWAEALPGMSYDHVTRCKDEAACRTRLEAAGESWPLVERNVAV